MIGVVEVREINRAASALGHRHFSARSADMTSFPAVGNRVRGRKEEVISCLEGGGLTAGAIMCRVS